MNPFLRVIRALTESQVRYVVVGGFAAVMHGNNRFTADLDIVVDLEPAQIKKALTALHALGFRSRLPVDLFDFADAEKRRSWIDKKNMMVFTLIDPKDPIFVVDIFAEPPLPFEDLYAASQSVSLLGTSARICSVAHLIEMKQASGRPQDLLDIEALTALQQAKDGK